VYYTLKKEALNNGQNYHLMAVLWRNGKIVKTGTNSSKTHPRFIRRYSDGSFGACMHAEMNVIRFAKPGDIIQVMRFKKCGEGLAMAKPCTHCMKHIREAGIKYVRYTNPEGAWETMKII
tara:strand:- start:519 stop:878 length:360 start_codon:yes stop_codon:yes gene_type:complete